MTQSDVSATHLAGVMTEAAATLENVLREGCGHVMTAAMLERAEAAARTLNDATRSLERLGRWTEKTKLSLGGNRWRARKWLPRLRDRVVADLPAPGEREPTRQPGILPLRFNLLRLVLRTPLVTRAEAKAMEDDLAQHIAHAAVFYHRRLTAQLERADPVDVRAVSFDQLRLEILQWLLDELNNEKSAANVRTHARIAARAALRRARAVIEDYVVRRGPAERFDVAIIVAQVEELGVLMERILTLSSDDDRRYHQLSDGGPAVVRDFMHSCGKLILATFRDIQERLADERLTVMGLRGALRQVETVRGLLLRVDAQANAPLLQASERIIRRKTALLVNLLLKLDAMPAAGRRAMLDELGGLLQRLSRQDGAGAAPP